MHVFGGLKGYTEWLRSTGRMPEGGLDALIEENQRSQQSPDVNTRIRHFEWADTYLNEVLVGKVGDARRKQIRYAVTSLYAANFSPLQGELRVALHDIPKKKKGILPEEARRVLLALPFPQRLPLLLQWQSGLNIFMVLCLRWGDLNLTNSPMRLDFEGRKTNRHPFWTLCGRDSVEGLRLWRRVQMEFLGREQEANDLVFLTRRSALPEPSYLNQLMQRAAVRLSSEGLLKSPPTNFATHSLRRCFKSTAMHLGFDRDSVEFMMGHSPTSNMSSRYDTRSDTIPEDFYRMYATLEPHLSLTPNQALDSATEKERLSREIETLRQKVNSLSNALEALQSSLRPNGLERAANPPPQAAPRLAG